MTETILEELKRIHDEADQVARCLASIHRKRLQCAPGCDGCCVDDIWVLEIEAERIRSFAGDLLQRGRPHPTGRCAFLSDCGTCRIHDARPYVCRTQGLPLRWISERDDGVLAERRDICELNVEGRLIEELSRNECWTIGPFEDRLSTLQREIDGTGRTRIRLRELFSRQA